MSRVPSESSLNNPIWRPFLRPSSIQAMRNRAALSRSAAESGGYWVRNASANGTFCRRVRERRTGSRAAKLESSLGRTLMITLAVDDQFLAVHEVGSVRGDSKDR